MNRPIETHSQKCDRIATGGSYPEERYLYLVSVSDREEQKEIASLYGVPFARLVRWYQQEALEQTGVNPFPA